MFAGIGNGALALGRAVVCAAALAALSACNGSDSAASDPQSQDAEPPATAALQPPALQSQPDPTTSAGTGASSTAPSISGSPSTTVVAGMAYVFQPSATSTGGIPLVFSIANLPSWAQFDPASGRLTGMPANADVGTTAPITISVSDGKTTTSLDPFQISVQAAASGPPPPDSPPTISGKPATTVQSGSLYSFQPSASDADGDALMFSITGKPSWASFSTQTGRLTGTPSSGNVGTFSGITISVSDGQKVTALATFAIQVTAPPAPPATNAPPTISGTPATAVQAGQAYSFKPAAKDANGDPLSFSVQNKPSWASFSIATGQLSGTPASGDTGTYGGILISVSDGKSTASLAAFTITVTAPPPPSGGGGSSGSVTLQWTQPTTNTDGSALADLAGYTILYGTAPNALNQSIDVPDPAATGYTVPDLSSGTWYFELVVDTATGAQSAPTNPVSMTVP